MKNHVIAVLLASGVFSAATFAEDTAIRESTDPQKIAEVEQRAQMLAQAQTEPGASSGTSAAGSTASSPPAKKKKTIKHKTTAKKPAGETSGAGASGTGASGTGTGTGTSGSSSTPPAPSPSDSTGGPTAP